MSGSGWSRVGLAMWLVQPLYLVAEIASANAVTVTYSMLDNSVSELGATTCTSIERAYGSLPVCSPAHLLFNAALVVFGIMTALGAITVRRSWPPGPAATAATVGWVLGGLSSVGSGLAPLDRQPTLHSVFWVSLLIFQSGALLLTGLLARGRSPVIGWVGAVAGAAAIAAVVILGVWLGGNDGGLLERLALWPAHLWLPLAAWMLSRSAPVPAT